MAEKPIIFSTEMVQAILDGRKTQTRRVVKHDPYRQEHIGHLVDGTRIASKNNKDTLWAGFYKESDIFYINDERHIDAVYTRCPYQPGDILWVRETWAGLPPFHNLHPEIERYIYKADGDATPLKWKSPRFMPKAAARIWLEVTSVRVERLQEITAEDIKNEGLTSMCVHAGDMEIAQQEFAILWNSTVKKQDLPLCGWDTNPWVWVIEFERSK